MRLPVTSHGEFFSTLDELGADQARALRRCARLRIDGRDMVLRDAEIHEGAISADPACAISARYPRDAVGDGLPILSQLRRSRGAIECAKHAALHELPYPGAKGQSQA